MASRPSWASLQRNEGPKFLRWLQQETTLTRNFDTLAGALSGLLLHEVGTKDHALEVFRSVPAVMSRCNDQETYAQPGAVYAYAWSHLLERYVRTWKALELLVDKACLPMGSRGVAALDVGTGPGPAAFAIYDFYAAMSEYAEWGDKPHWKQPAHITCVELDKNTNHFRHQLAEYVARESPNDASGVHSIGSAIEDLKLIAPAAERQELFNQLTAKQDDYFDEVRGEWVSDLLYTVSEANDEAQTVHRYRLICFSNFLTKLGTLRKYESNLIEILRDAKPGTVLLVLGGSGDQYQEIHQHLDKWSKRAGFGIRLNNERVSYRGTDVEPLVLKERGRVYDVLRNLAGSEAVDMMGTYLPRASGQVPKRSQNSSVRAYRK